MSRSRSHIAAALGVQAVEHHRKRDCCFATADLINALEQEESMNKAGQLTERLLRLDKNISSITRLYVSIFAYHPRKIFDYV